MTPKDITENRAKMASIGREEHVMTLDPPAATRGYVSADVLQLAQQINGAIAGTAKLEGARQEV
eukprot:CAMPEP_0117500290 /NCGR_PEP_ID=MMETSP0784-20121206/22700_1 /TAXON_ID=39447 /ORGANISM="" /LENGTH=63 /DNA_ID=CAMNT_0005295495 /DNA_START=70 /DNA_END=257 /DNA_ORIENTATION=-